MPTPLDRAMNSKNLFLGFAGMISAAAVWAIWGNDMFPAEQDPTGGGIRTLVDSSRTLTFDKTPKTGQPMS